MCDMRISEDNMRRRRGEHTVTPEWPPTTGTTSVDLERSPDNISDEGVDVRTTSRSLHRTY